MGLSESHFLKSKKARSQMQQQTQVVVVFILDVLKAVYQNRITEISKKLENINYINIESLTSKIETEIPSDKISENYEKILEIIESIIQD